jgi:hypothetical protein
MRHARFTLEDDDLDALHSLKRRLTRERETRVTIEGLLQQAVTLVLAHHHKEETQTIQTPASLATSPST